MQQLREQYGQMGIDPRITEMADRAEESLREHFQQIDRTAEFNQLKILGAMRKHRISAEHFSGSTGYGYNDAGRDDLEKVYADTFHTEDALVRPQITCGTHALAIALSAILRPGDEMLSISGKPYDTLEEVIGIRPSHGSLAEFGVTYRQVDLTADGEFDFEGIRAAITPKTRLIAIQRSRGYLPRPSLTVGRIAEIIEKIRPLTDAVIMVDNCYGEFVETSEPSDAGADMTVGSLIKNPGGGLAPIGGYIAGTRECIEKCSVRLTAPGLGKEVGASQSIMRSFYQGFFLAPHVTAAALKGAVLCSKLYGDLGFKVHPHADSERTDIIQSVELGSAGRLCAFCEGIQAAAPVDSYVRPVPWAMPGYDCDVIMAAGAFISGASIELSADAPLKEPYLVFMQGGLTYSHARFGVLMSLQKLYEQHLIELPL